MPNQSHENEVLAFGRVPSFRRYELHMERYRSASELIRQHAEIRPDSRILDVGSGFGFMKRFFDEEHGKWWGIEPWKERAEACRQLGYEILDLDLDGQSLPFPDDHFDVVIASHVIEHLRDTGAVVREMGRVTKPGGLLLVATPTKPPLFAGITTLYHRRRYRKSGDTQNAFTAWSLPKHLLENLSESEDGWEILDRRGFRVVSARRQLPLEDYRWFYKANLALAKALPWLVPEVNVILKKPSR